MNRPPRYRSFLLTAWEERGQEDESPTVWRFGLEDVHTEGRRRVFVTLEEVMSVVITEITGPPDRPMLADVEGE